MNSRRRFLTVVCSFILLFPHLSAFAEEITDEIDVIGPVIGHDSITHAVPAGETLIINTIITDNAPLKEVILFYREAEGKDYQSIRMKSGENHLYSGAIDGHLIKPPSLDYYIQASDEAGNSTLRGYSFSPLMVRIIPPQSESKEEPHVIIPIQETMPIADLTTENTKKTEEMAKPSHWHKNKKRWIVGIVTGVMVGVLISVSHSMSDDNSPVPINLTTSTGSVTDDAPIP